MNLYAITGRIVRKPERLETDNGTKICRICVAVDKTNKETAEDVDIFEVTLFRALAEEDYREGQFVAINGRMVANNYDAEGKIYYHPQLIGSTIALVNERV